MYIPETVIAILAGFAISAVIGFLWAYAAEKTIGALGWREASRDRARLDAVHRVALRDFIARAEAKGVDVPDSLRSAAV